MIVLIGPFHDLLQGRLSVISMCFLSGSLVLKGQNVFAVEGGSFFEVTWKRTK